MVSKTFFEILGNDAKSLLENGFMYFSPALHSIKNQSFHLHCNSHDWFLYEIQQQSKMGESMF